MSAATQPLTGVFSADPDHSSFVFAVKHMKVATFRASFDDVTARLSTAESGASLEGTARVESISIKNPPEFREHVVNGPDFFDAANHPEISFRSDSLELGDDGDVELEGELTIRGISRPLTASGSYQEPIENPFGAQVMSVELQATVDRREWGLSWNAPLPKGGHVLDNQVEITVQLELAKD